MGPNNSLKLRDRNSSAKVILSDKGAQAARLSGKKKSRGRKEKPDRFVVCYDSVLVTILVVYPLLAARRVSSREVNVVENCARRRVCEKRLLSLLLKCCLGCLAQLLTAP